MQKRYKLLCLDLDGTLLDDNKRVSEKTKQCLYKAKEMGVQIALLSGRMPYAIELIEKQIGFSCIKAASAGTYIYIGDHCISSKTLLPEAAISIYRHYAKTHNIPLWIYQERKWLVTEKDHYVKHETELIHYEPEVVDMKLLTREWEEKKYGPNKLLFGADADVINQVKEELMKENIRGIDFAKSTDVYLEIYPEGADKGAAALTICKELGILPEEMIAIGDQDLDIPMLAVAGTSVAMGNSPSHIKEMADYVTATNQEDGVAHAIEHFIF